MRYGVCTWTLGSHDLAHTAAFLAYAGLDGLELAGDLERYHPGDVASTLEDSGLAALSLTPQDVDLAHPDVAERDKAIDYYLRLLDVAAHVGAPVVSCHGAVGRVRPLNGLAREYQHLVAGVRRIAERAAELGIRVAMEALNRYESHLLNTSAEAMAFVHEVGAPNVGVNLDTYHMNIEESDLAMAILEAGDRLFLFHVADSNRRGVGYGHTDFVQVMRSLRRINYQGDLILECTAVGPDPFTPDKGPGWKEEVHGYVIESLPLLKTYYAQSKHL